ncbi:MAG: prolipoprotein diacylglyceryl transferase [Bythopirellula sp.]|nr:prolipoprotein diacylglyceryl transferase [Bythopirellula sp.]
MRSELFRIPLELNGVPLFGVGILLCAWIIACGFAMFVLTKKSPEASWKELLPGLVIGSIAIALLPRFFPEGLPIRGYGLMVLCGVIAGILLAMHRAQQVGLPSDTILSLAFSFLLCGIIGARLFYVVEYWDTRFKSDDWRETAWNVLRFTEGGLVIYGALLGAAVAVFWFVWRRKLPLLAMADLLAPSLLIGVAFGRIGCFLNGCCYGGECDLPWAITFPRESLPYMEQLEAGRFGDPVTLNMADWPARSLPVHPAQLYSAIDAALLCWLLWSYYPFRRRDGEVIALLFTLHPISRFLLEVIRIDESAVFGTGLSISQNISIVFFVLALVGWGLLLRQPPHRATFAPPLAA